MKTWEMLKMLTENPDLRFKGRDYYGNDVEVYFDMEDKFVKWTAGEPTFRNSEFILHKADWKLIKQPVDLITAIKAFAEGKTIRSSIMDGNFEEGTTYKLKDCDKVNLWIGFLNDKTGSAITAAEILEAKWYIED